MHTIIYRKRDRLIAGIVHERRTSEQTTTAVAAELSSLCDSELGGVLKDYATVEVGQATVPGMDTVVNPDRSVTWVANPERSLRRQNQESARIKLKTLGLTDDELTALWGISADPMLKQS